MEFSGSHPIPSIRTLADTAEAANMVISAPYMLTSRRVLSLVLPCGGPAVIGPSLSACLGTVTVRGDTKKKARGKYQDTLYPPKAMFPVILSLQHGLASDITQPGHFFPNVPLSQEVRRNLPVCTDTPLSDLCFLFPFPDINLRPYSIRFLSTHPPSFQELLPSLASYPHAHTCVSPLPSHFPNDLTGHCLPLSPPLHL